MEKIMKHIKKTECKTIILAIDDNVQQLKVFQGILASRYDLRVVKSASDALNYLNNNQADLILLDIEMPNISGFNFLTDIRKIPRYMAVPIIIVSGNTGEDFFKEAKNSTASDVLTKPVLPDVLINSIEKSLKAQ
jgi:PleD family two-component response regulator